MATTYTHCLRPVFTERIVQLLQKGRSINLIGAEGSGRGRLLDDIQRCELPNTRIVLVNLKSYRESYAGFIQAVWAQLGQDGDKPATLSELIERCEAGNDQIWLFLNNFDDLLDNPQVDPKYDTTFYDALNACRNKPNITLVCVTEAPHDQSIVFVNGKPHSNSWLDLERKPLPPLTYEEIVLEVKRQPLALTLQEQSAVIDAVRSAPKPYKLLEYLREKLGNREDASLPFQRRLQTWRKQFVKEEKRHLLSKKSVYQATQEMTTWSELTGISKLKMPFLLLGEIGKFLAAFLGKHSKKE
jgi:hypothetical protein